ncbi:MAG: Rieske 2Fe-2S domain-containing protein [Vicinamibacteria bacterium]
MQTRRSLLNWFLGTSAGAMCASVLYPVVRYLVPPDIPEAQTSRAVAAREGELKANEGRIFAFGGRAALLIHGEDGEYKAVSAVCTHLNCTVQYRGDVKQIWCACHNGFYDTNGRNISGPPPRPLEAYKVNVVNGDVVVSKS